MLEKIKSLGLRWKFGGLIFVALLLTVLILLITLRGFLNREFEALYGDPATKGLFVADLLANELEPFIETNRDAQEVQQTVDTYKAVYGIYGVQYLLVLDATSNVIVDTYQGRVPQSLIDLNPVS
ncbi:hypothetical protein GF339_04495, partial [candidate division KSB3 bacterium]|nr:hypothetical protein [candidate division KSB3 bacterium]MBD3323818.1 hypothetical protein [candidate division KSB3 bacterium]